ncbi:protein of unknown function [Candidatus Nitrospira inopinata]|uniref:Uncharacterized protein n=1 Tax=Candidatus Nitrospira inopinata TaxID=1715989 RepID=A0A0S4KZW6_9BACT|nr:protein of unknown function [Candidatus Nitrospira inopinata]
MTRGSEPPPHTYNCNLDTVFNLLPKPQRKQSTLVLLDVWDQKMNYKERPNPFMRDSAFHKTQ